MSIELSLREKDLLICVLEYEIDTFSDKNNLLCQEYKWLLMKIKNNR